MVTRYIKDAFLYGAGDTVVGQVRKANEDNCGYRKTINGELFVVCDGMGGHVGGATASRIAVDSILNYVGQQFYSDKRVVLGEALKFANMQILGAAAQDTSLKGMGTTACIALVDAQDIWIAHVGDSRIYLHSEQEKYLYRITKDHSLVQGLVDRGELDDREAEHHPQKNIILRALGTKTDLEVDVEQSPVRAQVGDTLLICSDGLSGMIDDNEIEAILNEDRSLEDKVQRLIDSANAPDKGKDNITVQLIQIQSSLDNLSAHPNYNPKWRRPSGITATSLRPAAISGENKAASPIPQKKTSKTSSIVLYVLGLFVCAISVVVILFLLGKLPGDDKTHDGLKEPENEAVCQTQELVEKAEEENAQQQQQINQQQQQINQQQRQIQQQQQQINQQQRQIQQQQQQIQQQKQDQQQQIKQQEQQIQQQQQQIQQQQQQIQQQQNQQPQQQTQQQTQQQQDQQSQQQIQQQQNQQPQQQSQQGKIIEKTITLQKGKENDFCTIFGIAPEESKSIAWSPSDTKVVSLTESATKKGIKGEKKGTATITGESGKIRYKLTVKVK